MSITNTMYDTEITIERIACPLHVIALKKGLDEINDNGILKVITGGESIGQELTSACQVMGYKVESMFEKDETVLYVKKSTLT